MQAKTNSPTCRRCTVQASSTKFRSFEIQSAKVRLIRLVCVLFPLVLLSFAHAQPAFGAPLSQDQEPQVNQELIARVISLIESPSPPDRAWGAYLAHKNGLRQFTPNLVDALRALAGDAPDTGLVTSAVLDSLIQLDAEVPSDVIMSLNPRFSYAKLILLAHNPLANKDALLDLMRNGYGKVWRAAGNLLTEVRAPGLAAFLLKDLHISVSVLVVDPGTGGGSGGSGGGSVGDSILGIPKGYPPIGFYNLYDYPRRGYVVLAPGPTTIYYCRTVVDPGTQIGWGDSASTYDRNEAAVEYLAALLNTTPADLGLKSAPSFSEEWKGAAALTRRLKQIRTEITAKYQSVVSRLVDQGLLTDSEASEAAAHIEIHLSDLRTRQSIPLPKEPSGS